MPTRVLLQRGRVAAVDVGAAPEDDGGALFDGFQVEGAAIFQRVVGGLRGHEVVALGAIDGVGHDAEGERIELRQLAQEAAALAVRAVSALVFSSK